MILRGLKVHCQRFILSTVHPLESVFFNLFLFYYHSFFNQVYPSGLFCTLPTSS